MITDIDTLAKAMEHATPATPLVVLGRVHDDTGARAAWHYVPGSDIIWRSPADIGFGDSSEFLDAEGPLTVVAGPEEVMVADIVAAVLDTKWPNGDPLDGISSRTADMIARNIYSAAFAAATK